MPVKLISTFQVLRVFMVTATIFWSATAIGQLLHPSESKTNNNEETTLSDASDNGQADKLHVGSITVTEDGQVKNIPVQRSEWSNKLGGYYICVKTLPGQTVYLPIVLKQNKIVPIKYAVRDKKSYDNDVIVENNMDTKDATGFPIVRVSGTYCLIMRPTFTGSNDMNSQIIQTLGSPGSKIDISHLYGKKPPISLLEKAWVPNDQKRAVIYVNDNDIQTVGINVLPNEPKLQPSELLFNSPKTIDLSNSTRN